MFLQESSTSEISTQAMKTCKLNENASQDENSQNSSENLNDQIKTESESQSVVSCVNQNEALAMESTINKNNCDFSNLHVNNES